MAQQVCRYLNWLGVKTKIFNAGNYRREHLGIGQTSDWWSASNVEAARLREEVSRKALYDLLAYLKQDGVCGIFDATNTTRERRQFIIDLFLREKFKLHKIVFVESVCNDEAIIENNIRGLKVHNRDYENKDEEEAIKDFKKRIENYKQKYEPIDDKYDADKSWIKIIDVGRQFIANRIRGYLPHKILTLLMTTHLYTRTVLLCRHGESLDNVANRVGGNSDLSERGKCFAPVVNRFIKEKYKDRASQFRVWTSTLNRAKQSCKGLDMPIKYWKALDELNGGLCEGLTFSAIEKKFPNEIAKRMKNKFLHRWPRGESYKDVVARIDPVVLELERKKKPILIISHQAVTRVLYAYLKGISPQECTNMEIPLHTIIEITPNTQTERRYNLNRLVNEEYQRRTAALSQGKKVEHKRSLSSDY